MSFNINYNNITLNIIDKSSILDSSKITEDLIETYKKLNIEKEKSSKINDNNLTTLTKENVILKENVDINLDEINSIKDSNDTKETNVQLTKAQTLSLKGLSIATKLVNVAFNSLLGIFISIAATKILSFLDDLINKEANLAKAANESKIKISELNKELLKQKKTIKQYSSEYAELAQGVDSLTNKNLSLSTDDYDKFIEISNILNDVFPELTKRFDDNGNAILDLDGNVNTITDSLNELILTQERLSNQKIYKELPNIYDDYYNSIDKVNDKINEQVNVQKSLEEARDTLLKYNGKQITSETESQNYQSALHMFGVDDYSVETSLDQNGNVGYIYSNERFKTDKEISYKYNELFMKSQNEIDTYQETINSKLTDVKNTFTTLLSTDYDFVNNLTDSLQSGIIELFRNFDINNLPDYIDSSNGEDVYSYLKSIYLAPVLELNKDVQETLGKVFSQPPEMSNIEYIKMVDELQSYFDSNNIKINLDFVVEDEKELQNRLTNVIEKITNGDNNQINILNSFIDEKGIDTTSEIENFINIISQVESETEPAKKAIELFYESLKQAEYADVDNSSIFEGLDSIRSAYSTVKDAVEEYRNSKYLSLETIEELLQLDDVYLRHLYDENGQLTLNKESYDNLTQAKLDELYVSTMYDALNTINNLGSEAEAAEELKLINEDLTETNWKLVKSDIARAYASLDAEDALGLETEARRQKLANIESETLAKINLLKEASKGIKFEGFYESKSSKQSSSKNEFSKEFDWISNSVDNVTNSIENLNNKLNNTSGFKERIAVYDELINKDQDLINATKNAASAYEKEWNKASSKIGNNYKNKITSGNTFNIDTITDETLADNIDNAQKAYENWQSMLQQYDKAVAQKDTDEDNKIKTLLELEELRLDILSLDNQEVMSAKEKNNYIKEEETLKQNILNYNLKLAETEEEKTRLQKEYNEYLKENKRLVYENNKEERDNKISYYDSRIQDIQNAIDYSESKGGQGTEQQYAQINKYIEIQKRIERANYEAALSMRNNATYGISEWEQYNQEIQTAQNNLYSLSTAQIENNRAILKLPIQTLEKSNELLQEQLDIVSKTKEKVEDSINSASNIIQNQIDSLTDQKEATEEYWDSQINLINEQKEALTKANEEIEHKLALEKAQYELEKANSQKNVKVYREGIGFTYEADQEAIRNAQENLDTEEYNNKIYQFDVQLDALEKSKEEAINSIDVQINSLELYKERIDSITSSYENMLQLQTLISMFGEDATDRLMNGDLSIIDEMKNLYNETTSQATSLQLQIEANEAAIEQIELYADKWNGSSKTIVAAKQLIEQTVSDNIKEIESIKQRTDTVKTINDAWEETRLKLEEELGFIKDNQIVAKDEESIILEERLENIKAFSEKASSYLKEISNALSKAELKQEELNKISEGTVSKPSNNNSNKTTPQIKSQIKTMGKKHSGIASGYVGENNSFKNKFKYIALSELKPEEIPSILLKGEAVLTNEQQLNVLDNMKNSFLSGMNIKDINSIPVRKDTVSNHNIEFNGDIVLQNINNPDSLAKAIKNDFLLKLDQEYYKN